MVNVADASKANIALSKMHLSLRKSTYIWVRFVFTGVSEAGTQKVFFIELEAINAALSPNKPVLGYKYTGNITSDDLQSAMSLTQSAQDIGKEDTPPPSYIAVRCGTLGAQAKQLAVYDSVSNLASNKGQIASIAGCLFSDNALRGSIMLSNAEVSDHPEYLCNAGAMDWDIKYRYDISSRSLYKKAGERWTPIGSKARFIGNVTLDGESYEVTSNKSYGYIDFSEAKNRTLDKALPVPYFHISSSFLTSHITGMTMKDSCIVIHGLYGQKDNVAILVKLLDKVIAVKATKRGVRTIQECTQAPADEDGERLHWSMSVDLKGTFPYGKYVIDVDVMCHTKLLSVRNIELPSGKRQVMRLLSGGDGVGTVKLFQHVKNNLVLIEEAHMANTLCEFGALDTAAV